MRRQIQDGELLTSPVLNFEGVVVLPERVVSVTASPVPTS